MRSPHDGASRASTIRDRARRRFGLYAVNPFLTGPTRTLAHCVGRALLQLAGGAVFCWSRALLALSRSETMNSFSALRVCAYIPEACAEGQCRGWSRGSELCLVSAQHAWPLLVLVYNQDTQLSGRPSRWMLVSSARSRMSP